MADNAYLEGTNQEQRTITGDEDDSSKLKKFDRWWDESEPLNKMREKWCKDNFKDYIGDPEADKRAKWRSNTVHNKQFENIETIVPNMTEKVPEPTTAVPGSGEDEFEYARIVGKALLSWHRRDQMQMKSESIIRHMELHRDGFVMPGFDETLSKLGEITTTVLHPDNIRIDPNWTYFEQGEYFFVHFQRSLHWAIDRWPEKKAEIAKAIGVDSVMDSIKTPNGISPKDGANLLDIKQCWHWRMTEGKMRIWRSTYVKEVLLEDDINPYWDDEGFLDPQVETKMNGDIQKASQAAILAGQSLNESDIEQLKQPYEQYRKYLNFFEKERLPLVQFPTYFESNQPYSITSKIEQTRYLQQSLNKTEQQIDENKNMMANGQWVVDRGAGVDVKKLTNAPGLVVEKNDGKDVHREAGVPLPTYVMEYKRDVEQSIDNIWGANNILKGQNPGANVPARTSILLERNEKGRLALMSRHFEMGMEELYKWVVHLMKLFYDEERQFGVEDNQGNIQEFLKIKNDRIPDNLQLYVKVGASQPRDLDVLKADMKDLFSAGKLDPITFFKYWGEFPDPAMTAENLWKWQQGTLFNAPQPSIEDVTRQELDAILKGERVLPNKGATEMSIQIQAEALKDRAQYPFTDQQIKVLEEKIQSELQMVQAQKQKALAQQHEAMMQPDPQPQGDQGVPPEQIPA